MATYTSATSWLWSSWSTWVWWVKPPSWANHKIVIASWHTVTYDEASGNYGDDTTTAIELNWTLKASRTVSTAFTARGNIRLLLWWGFDYGTEADPIPSSVKAQILLNDSASMAVNKYWITSDGWVWSKFSIWWSPKTADTIVSAPSSSSDTVIQVADATWWQIWDKLVFDWTVAENSLNWHRVRAITWISWNNITLWANLWYASPVGRRVINLTRNVYIWPSNISFRSYCAIIFHATSWVDILELWNFESALTGSSPSNSSYGWGITIFYAIQWSTIKHVKKIQDIALHNIGSIVGTTVTQIPVNNAPLVCFWNQSIAYEVVRPVMCTTWTWSAIVFWSGSSAIIKDPVVIRPWSFLWVWFSQWPVNAKIQWWYVSLAWTLASWTWIKVSIEDTVFDWLNSYGQMSAMPDMSISNCQINQVLWGFWTTNNLVQIVWSYLNMVFDSCTIPSSFYVINTANSNLATASEEYNLRFKNTNNDPTNHRAFRRGGQVVRDNAISYRSTSSLAMYPFVSTTPVTYKQNINVSAGQAIRVLWYCRYNSTYGTAQPTTLTISGLGVTPVVFTCPTTWADIWHPIDITVTNPQTYPWVFTMTFSAWSNSWTQNAIAYFDGILIDDFITSARHYWYIFDSLAYRTVNPYITESNESSVWAYSGISINHTTDTITITQPHSIEEIYDYVYYDLCQTANLSVPEYFTTDGATYTTSYNIINNSTLSGTGTLITTGTYTWSGTTTLVVKDSVGVRCKITSGGDTFTIKWATIAYDDDITEKLVTVAPNTDVSFVMWKLGYKPQLFTINSGSLGGTFNISMLDITEAVDTALNVAPIIALTSTTVDMSGYHMFFWEMELSLEQMKAVVHRLMQFENYFDAVLATWDDNIVEVRSDEIRVNKPLFTIEREASLTLADRVQLNGYINISNAVSINPLYIINPWDSDGLYVTYLTVKPWIDAEYLAGKVWENPDRTLTENPGLTAEEHDRLFTLPTSAGGWFRSSSDFSAQDRKLIKETHEKVLTLENTIIPDYTDTLSEINSHIELAKTDVIDTIKETENEVCSDIVRKTKELKNDNISTRNLVREKTKKIDQNVSKLADRQDLTDKMIENEADEIEEQLEKIFKEEADMIEQLLEDQYKKEAQDIENELNS